MTSNPGDDLLRRLQLSIDGFARNDHMSTWVSDRLHRESKAEIERLNAGLDEATNLLNVLGSPGFKFTRRTSDETDVRRLNREMCATDGHAFSNIATHRCFRCGTEILPGAYMEHMAQRRSEETSARYETRGDVPHDGRTLCPPESNCSECYPENGDAAQP